MKQTDAYSFVLGLIRRRRFLRTEPWSPCMVIEVARAAGIEFADDRKWGEVFLQLQRDGYIKRAGMFPRHSSNGSLRPGWIGA